MKIKELWSLPANCLYEVKLLHNPLKIRIFIEYYNEEDEQVYNNYIEFSGVITYNYCSEKFSDYIINSYNTLCILENSNLIKKLSKKSPEWFKINEKYHFAIYLDSYGQYEIVATSFEISESKRGYLSDKL